MGEALGTRLEANIARYLRERPQRPDALDLAELRRGALPWLRRLPERFQDELEGLAEGANVPLQRVAEWNYVEQCIDDACSAFLGRIDGHVWIARNNDMLVPGIWGHAVIREIAGRIPTLSFGQEGDVFTATGVNRDEGMLLFAVDGKSDEFAILECGSSRHARRPQTRPWMVGTNHALCLDEPPPGRDSRSRHARMEAMAAQLYERSARVRLPEDLLAILADDMVERRGAQLSTVYATVASPWSGALWFTFGGYPAASRGNWRPVDWPW